MQQGDLYSSIPLKNEPIRLTAEQQAAFDALLPGLEDAAPHSALLYGVTGSGKTLVFLKLIERCLALGRRALVLVPEISLTPQMILRLKGQFGRRVAVQHSALNHTERLLQWQMIQDGGADPAPRAFTPPGMAAPSSSGSPSATAATRCPA